MTGNEKITPCLWFDRNAEEAVNHYMSIFKAGRRLPAGIPQWLATFLS